MSRFMDPTTDFGFKKLFGEEANKEIIMSFITDVLELETPLLDISFLDKEQLPDSPDDRVGIYDIFCKDVAGNSYIVEMQKNRVAYEKDRMLYYATFPIAAQAKKGKLNRFVSAIPKATRVRDGELEYGGKIVTATDWDFELKGVYCIAVLSYALEGSKTAVNRSSLRNDVPPHEVFYDKLRFVTIELPLFDESLPEYSLDVHLNKWLYFLKYLPDIDQIPEIFKSEVVFQQAFQVAELANLGPDERRLYERNVMRLLYAQAVMKYNLEKGMAEGRAKGMAEGRAKGMAEGRAKGMAEGRAEGRTEGRAEGRAEGKHEGLIEGQIKTLNMLLTQRLGVMPADIESVLRNLKDAEKIDSLLTSFAKINDWESLRKIISK